MSPTSDYGLVTTKARREAGLVAALCVTLLALHLVKTELPKQWPAECDLSLLCSLTPVCLCTDFALRSRRPRVRLGASPRAGAFSRKQILLEHELAWH